MDFNLNIMNFLQTIMALVAVMGVILYRMSVLAALSIHGDTVLTGYAIIFTSTTAACINLVCIMIFNQVKTLIFKFVLFVFFVYHYSNMI